MRTKVLLLSVLSFAALATLIIFGFGNVQSQQSTDIPPEVIDVWPLPGTEMAGDQPLTITFNQPMNQASVEAAVSFEPALSGTFNWPDARTLEFTPDNTWPAASTYEVTVGTGATAANELSLLDPYTFSVNTIDNLAVTAVTPTDGAEGVAANAQVVITFNRPVVPLVSTEQLEDLPNPLTIDPPVEGTGEWLNTSIYTFTPEDVWRGGTTYNLIVPAELTGFDGAILPEAFSWTFKTLPPQIQYVSPGANAAKVLLDQTISVTFSQPMDTASVEAAFSLLLNGEPVAGKFEWSEDATSFIFTPDEMLQIASTYTLNISQEARSAFGEATLTEGLTQSFSTVPYPGIEQTSPRNGESGVRPGRGASITFKSPMNTNTFEGKVEISPETEWEPRISGNQSIYLEFSSLPNTTYTITFKAGAEDIYGNVIETDYTFSFVTGEIETWAYPLTNSDLTITGAHNNNTRLAMVTSGTPRVQFELYQLPNENVQDAIQNRYRYRDDEIPAWENEANLMRRWEQEFDSQGQRGIPKPVYLASEEGGLLDNGIYWVKVNMLSSNSYYQDVYRFPLSVASAGITVKRSPDDTMLWVTDMVSAAPLVETTVTIYQNNQAIARGRTDADGIFRTPIELPTSDDFIHITVEDGQNYGIWYSGGEANPPTQQGYMYTDRPLYRPGETVYFKGVLRDREDVNYSIPNLRTVWVTIDGNYGSERLFEAELPVTEFGTFSGEFEIPEEVQLGTAYIYNSFTSGSVRFEIAEFRVPEFEVSVTPQQDYIFYGDSLTALTSASFYFGGSVSNAQVNWNASGNPTSFNYTGPGRYSFYDDTADYSYIYLDGSGTTDADGNFMISAENVRPNNPTTRPMNLAIEGTVTDESFQAISGRGSLTVHPANVYVGLRSDSYFGREGQPVNFDLIAVDVESVPLADKNIDLSVVEIRWERVPIEGEFGRYTWERTETEVETANVRTNENGMASYQFTPPNAGIFRLKATALDERERPNSSTLRFWVTGTRPVWWGEPSEYIDLIADADSYKPGDTAQILVPIPFSGKSTVLVTTERMGIMSYEVLEIEGSTLLYELPITDEHAPTVHFTATVVKGIDDENRHPDFRTGRIALQVEPVEKRLTVTLTPSVDLAQPRDTISIDVLTTDVDGNPVSAEVGLAMTDKAILALMPPNSGTLENTFYGSQSNYVYTVVSLDGLIDALVESYVGEDETEEEMAMDDVAFAAEADGATPAPTATAQAARGGEAPGQQPDVTVREDFQQTPLWQAHVVTNKNGQATVNVDLPDNLTTWKLDARAVTLQTTVGQTTDEVMATLPLLIRPVAPRFFVVGDRVELAAVVNNNTTEEQSVEVSLEYDGLELESDATQTVTIPASSRARVAWTSIVQDVDFIDLTFIAIGADGYTDATKPTLATGPDNTIPVYRYTAPDTVGTGGILRDSGSRTEGIVLPPRLDPDQGELTIHLDPSLAVTTIDSFEFLKNYPHQCIEQTVSRFLPNVMTYRALRDLGIEDPVLEAQLLTMLEEALLKLETEQNADGGWGWFPNMESNPYVTSYAALGLVEARDAGFEVNQEMLAQAMNYVKGEIIRNPDVNTSDWRLNRQAFYFYVLARDNQGNVGDFNSLFEHRLRMTYAGRAFLLMAYLEADPQNPVVNDLSSDLTTAAILSATGAHWEEEYNDWWNWSSDTRTTAIVLNALVRLDPNNDLLPNVVRWLMVARQGDHWETTQETAWAVMSLTDWMVTTGELQGNYEYSTTFNEDTLTREDVTPETVREGQVLRVAVSDILQEELNRLVIARGEGEGVLYYTAHLNLRLLASEVDAIDRGIKVSREYFLEDAPETPVTAAEIGDVITVRLTLNLSQDIHYFVLEDPLPAGTESVNTALLTTSQISEPPVLSRQNRGRFYDLYNPYWYWGWWWFDHTELRDEQTNLYADFLPRGTYVYTYQIRASVPGEFQTMPSHAYAFYFPEVFGRTGGTLFTVTQGVEQE